MYDTLSTSALFAGLSPQEVENLLHETEHSTWDFAEGDVVALRGSKCKSLLVLVSGRLAAEKSDKRRRPIKIEAVEAPALLAPVCLFSAQRVMPVTFTAAEMSSVMFVEKDAFLAMMQSNTKILENFLKILSGEGHLLSERITFFAFKTIKSKFAHFLLEQSAAAGSSDFRLRHTQREISEMFGVTRPALARAIGEMVSEGAIIVDCKNVSIVYPEKLKQYI